MRETGGADRTGSAPGAACPVPTVLVAYNGSPMSEVQLHLAGRSANDTGSRVRVLYVMKRRRHVPLDVPLSPEEQGQIDAVLDRAEQIVSGYGVPVDLAVLQARAVGEAIVQEAREHHAQAIFIGLRDRHRPGTALVLSGTLRQVLHRAPCPVQIGYLPAALAEAAART